MKKLMIITMVALMAVTFTNCSKSGDPTPIQAQKTSLDSVKTAMVGTWKFKSVTVQQFGNGKIGTAVDCSKTGLTSAGFTNTNWQSLAGPLTYEYSNSTMNVNVFYPCQNNGAGTTDPSTFNVSQLDTNNFQFYSTSTSGAKTTLTFVINKHDITSTSIKAKLISNGTAPNSGYVSATLGYAVTYQFTR